MNLKQAVIISIVIPVLIFSFAGVSLYLLSNFVEEQSVDKFKYSEIQKASSDIILKLEKESVPDMQLINLIKSEQTYLGSVNELYTSVIKILDSLAGVFISFCLIYLIFMIYVIKRYAAKKT